LAGIPNWGHSDLGAQSAVKTNWSVFLVTCYINLRWLPFKKILMVAVLVICMLGCFGSLLLQKQKAD